MAKDEASYRYLVESIERFPDMKAFAKLIGAAGFRNVKTEPILGGLVAIHSGWEDLTSSVTHVWRLLKWGRVLARHGALRGIEHDPEHAAAGPPACAGSPASARGCRTCPLTPPRFRPIGPAAIKLGQALATRPDLVGEEAAHDLALLQDSLPPAPFEPIKTAIERGLGKPLDQLFRSVDPEPVGAASIAQVHRAVTTEGREGRGQGAAAQYRGGIRRRDRHLRMGRRPGRGE